MNTDATIIQTLIERVTELEARSDIRDLVSDYCHGFDKRNYQRFLSIWSIDCVWDIGPPFGCFKGHAGIHEAIHQVLWPAWHETHHLTTNLCIKFQDQDNATSLCDVDCMGTLSGESTCTVVGASYSDTLRREASGWKILKRNVQIHYMNPLSGTVLSVPEATPG